MPIASRYELVEGKIKFIGTVRKAGARPNPTIDHIMSGLGSADSDQQAEVETSGFVTLNIPSDGTPEGSRPIDIGLNGRNYKLPRDTPATVPVEIAQILQNAEKSVSVVPMTKGERVVCQVDPESGTYLPGRGPQTIENRRFNLEIGEVD